MLGEENKRKCISQHGDSCLGFCFHAQSIVSHRNLSVEDIPGGSSGLFLRYGLM